eukprot:GFUD01028078.1.p1 GENE.GFUD01028078.1~~GFUD01028078.1.p1  ORF type:complete len:252 (+),score=87.76 GFUD01028078.1:54-809(+)
MLKNMVAPLLIAGAIYLYLPRSERNLLVILQADSETLKLEQIQEIGQIKNAFHIIQNVDGHMEHVDVTTKLDYNYVLVSTDMAKEEEEQFRAKIEQLEYVKKMEIFPYKTNPLRIMLINLILKIKGIVFNQNLEKSENVVFDGAEHLCTGENAKLAGAKVMVNIIKMDQNKKDALEAYNKKVVFELFPKIGSFIFDSGTVDSDYWSMAALMQYQSVADLCRMVNSKEYMEVVKFKVEGLLDTHTYLTNQII